jgi:hypothetical protein
MEGIEKCASLYGFSVEDAVAKIMESKKKVKIVAPKSSFALPFSGEKVENCCEGLRYNDGLYTQCEVLKKGETVYCAVCTKGNLKYGTITDRMNAGIMEYKDPSGKSPVHYSKIMKKLKITKEEVLLEGIKMKKNVSEVHLEVQEEKRGRPKVAKAAKEEKKKGRPKKAAKGLELESKTTDLFASLIANSSSEIDDLCEEEFVKNSTENGVNIIAEEHVMSEDLSKVMKAQEKAVFISAKALEKSKKDEEKALALAKKAEEKVLALAKKEEEKALALAKKAEEKALALAEKASKKVVKEKVVKEKVVKEKVVKMVTEVKEMPHLQEDQEDTVERITQEGVKCKKSHQGVQYFKSKNSGVIYNMEHDVIGKWDDVTGKIMLNPVGDELEEDECDSDSE